MLLYERHPIMKRKVTNVICNEKYGQKYYYYDVLFIKLIELWNLKKKDK